MSAKILLLDIDIHEDGTVIGKRGKPLKPRQDKHSSFYKQVKVGNKWTNIHRLVAEKYVPNPDNLPQVNHIDGNKDNNHYSNLEWCTQQQNLRHAMKLGLHAWGTTDIVARNLMNQEIVFNSQAEASRLTGVVQPNINKVLNRTKRSAGGYGWSYVS